MESMVTWGHGRAGQPLEPNQFRMINLFCNSIRIDTHPFWTTFQIKNRIFLLICTLCPVRDSLSHSHHMYNWKYRFEPMWFVQGMCMCFERWASCETTGQRTSYCKNLEWLKFSNGIYNDNIEAIARIRSTELVS